MSLLSTFLNLFLGAFVVILGSAFMMLPVALCVVVKRYTKNKTATIPAPPPVIAEPGAAASGDTTSAQGEESNSAEVESTSSTICEEDEEEPIEVATAATTAIGTPAAAETPAATPTTPVFQTSDLIPFAVCFNIIYAFVVFFVALERKEHPFYQNVLISIAGIWVVTVAVGLGVFVVGIAWCGVEALLKRSGEKSKTKDGYASVPGEDEGRDIEMGEGVSGSGGEGGGKDARTGGEKV